jgi:hypothetical protein
MIAVSEVLPDVKRVLGGCDDETAYSRINDAVEILSTEAYWDPLVGYLDVCVGCDGYITLPWQVDTVLAVNVAGRPTQAHDFWFQFHLNGPGNNGRAISWHWADGVSVATYRPLPSAGAYLSAVLESSEDTGKSFRVYGYGVSGDWIRTLEDGVWVDGFEVPLVHGSSPVNPAAPRMARVERILKDETVGTVKLYATDSAGTRTRVGLYRPKETIPQYRRIRVGPACSWARVGFRRASEKVSELTDVIHLHSKYSIVLMVKSLKKMDEDRLEEAVQYQRMAVELLSKKQDSQEVPAGPSIQMANQNLIADKSDRLD